MGWRTAWIRLVSPAYGFVPTAGASMLARIPPEPQLARTDALGRELRRLPTRGRAQPNVPSMEFSDADLDVEG